VDLAATVGDKVAALIGAARQRLAAPELTTTQAVITRARLLRPAQQVVLVGLEFPSILYFLPGAAVRAARGSKLSGTQTYPHLAGETARRD